MKKFFLKNKLSQSLNILGHALNRRHPKLLYVSGCPGVNNLGDDALFDAYNKLFSDYDLIHYPGGKLIAAELKFFQVIKHSLLAGGTLINRWGADAAVNSLRISKTFNIFGTGVAQDYFWDERETTIKDNLNSWDEVLRNANYLGVRGPLSANFLIDNGYTNAEVIGDPVLFLAQEDNNYFNTSRAKTIGINIGQSNNELWGKEENICDEYIKLAKKLRTYGWKIDWFVLWPKDREITLKAAKHSGTTDNIYEVYSDYRKYFELTQHLSIFIGMKLHSVVLSTCKYIPSIMLEYRPKCLDFMRSINMEMYNIRTDTMNCDSLYELIVDMYKGREKISKSLYEKIATIKARQKLKSRNLIQTFE